MIKIQYIHVQLCNKLATIICFIQTTIFEPDLYANIIKIAGPGSNPTVANLETALKTILERGKTNLGDKTIADSLDLIIKNADIIVGAVGIPKFIKSDWIKKGAVVIDAGYHPEKCGDIDLDNIEEIASAYTPVPGGVGPMTINTLILQTLQSAERAASN